MFAKSRASEGGWALPTVLGGIMVLALIAVGVATQVRSELKAGALEPEVAQGQAMVMAALNEVAQAAKNTPAVPGFASSAPNPTQAPPAGWQPCTPIPVDAAKPEGAAYCSDVLQRVSRSVRIGNVSVTRYQVPVAVRWRMKATETPRVAYAWLIIVPADPTNVTVYYYHRWCRVK
ncbi:MAG TPA: hypothetical protein VNT75_21825, partial [Symbiobacteriaceae bacterium]|nr:hypothetical protein [Symbiobacteriaceae bacterium]